MNFGEILKARKDKRKVILRKEAPKKNRFSGRLYDIIGHRTNGETIEHKSVTSAKAKALREQLIREGFYRIDKIEVRTRILDENNQRINLEPKPRNYAPKYEGSIPATVSASEKKIIDDRNKMHTSNVLKMMRRDNLVKNDTDDKMIRIYSKIETTKVRSEKDKRRVIHVPKLVFSGTEDEAVFFVLNHMKNIRDYHIYLPEKKGRK